MADQSDWSPKLTTEERKHISALFSKLDVNNDGKICLDDLARALGERLPDYGPRPQQSAEDFMARLDLEPHEHIDFNKFVTYVLEQDKKLLLAFKHMDTNADGHIDAKEIQHSFKKLGIQIDMKEATKLLKRVDMQGNWLIDFNEWRDFFIFHPTGKLTDIVQYWRHNSFIDVGEEAAIPEDFSTEERQSGRYMWTLLAGGLAGAVSRTCTAPLDRVKVMMQVYGYKHKSSGLLSTFRYMYSEGGVVSMWRGNCVNVVKIAPETAIKYASYEQYKLLISQWTTPGDFLDTSPMFCKFVSGSMAGSTAQTIIYPLEVMKTRMCLRKTGQYSSIVDCAVQVFREGGIRAFFRGYLPNLCGIIPYAGIEMAFYETCKSVYMNRFEPNVPSTNHPPFYVIPVMASFSSMCGILATYPLAVIRTKLQSKSAFKASENNSALGLFRLIWADEGPRGFYRGITANLFKVIPAVSISYGMFETLNRRFDLQSFGSK